MTLMQQGPSRGNSGRRHAKAVDFQRCLGKSNFSMASNRCVAILVKLNKNASKQGRPEAKSRFKNFTFARPPAAAAPHPKWFSLASRLRCHQAAFQAALQRPDWRLCLKHVCVVLRVNCLRRRSLR